MPGGTGGPDWSRTSGTRFRKPLLYPSELRGHGRATLVHRFDLREQPLALSKLPARALATELAPVSELVALLITASATTSRSTTVRPENRSAPRPPTGPPCFARISKPKAFPSRRR